MVAAGINDWGGVSPVTPDHVNPEAPWPALDALAERTAAAGKLLVERLAIYPDYARDARALARSGTAHRRPARDATRRASPAPITGSPAPDRAATRRRALDRPVAEYGRGARGRSPRSSTGPRPARRWRGRHRAAVRGARRRVRPRLRARPTGCAGKVNGDTVSYVVTRNINYTNICYFRCQFCAFSKGKLSENLRGRPYDLDLAEIQRRGEEAWERGATEVCLQGGIHPEYTGATYLGVCRAIKEAVPGIHIHAFSPLEIWQGAKTLGRTSPISSPS